VRGWRWIVFAAPAAFACGGNVSHDAPTADASTEPDDATAPDAAAAADGSSDSGAFACGDSVCQATEICVYPGCGCALPTEPVSDAGTCADGSTFVGALNACTPTNVTCQPPACASPSPSNPLDCSGAEGSLNGVIDAVPTDGGRVCHGNCV
jgi:hypothetical protein